MLYSNLLFCLALLFAAAAQGHPGQHEQLLELDRHIAQMPTAQTLFIQRGMVYSESGQYDEALADYARAQQLGPPELVAFELGVLYYRMGEYERAVAYLNEYLQRFPDYPPAYDYLARIARDAGDYDLAVTHLETYFRLQERPNPGHYLAAARMLAETGRYAEALAIVDQGLATLGVIPQLQRYAITLELERQQPELALARLDTLAQMLGESPAWKLDRAGLLLQLERSEEAAALALAAQAELSGLRPTPARQALQLQAVELLARLASGR